MRRVFIIVIVLLISGYITAQDVKQGAKLPSVNVKTLEGQTFNVQNIDNNGNPIIISFWALWCKPCKKELDAYNDNYEDWRDETGVKIIAVSIDDSRSTAKVLPFVNGKDWEFEVLLDPNGDLKRAMSVNMIPHTFILDGEGNIVYQHTSYYEGLEDEIFEIVEKVAAGENISGRKVEFNNEKLRMKKVLTILLFAFAITSVVSAQGFLSKSQVHGSFEIDGMYYHADDALGITESDIDGNIFGFNAFADIIYTIGDFSAGFRYEAYLPPIAGFDPSLDGQGFPYLWASYTTEKFSFTVGNFYEQFGNGLTLRTYQEWTLGYDNSINGARVIYEPIKGLILKGVYGTQRYFWAKYEKNGRGIVKGFDAEVSLNDVFTSMAESKIRLTLGGSAVSKYQADENPFYKMPKNVASFAGRFNLGIGKFNFSSEYAYKINDPSAVNNYIYKPGDALVFTGSYSTKGLGVFAMFKRIDNMSYKSDASVTSNALDINFLPAMIEPHTYMLAAMYPYATQPNGEIGYQIAINYKVPKKSKLGGKYGMGIAINYSQINDIAREKANDTAYIGQSGTMGWTSDFFKFGDQVFNRDLTIEIDKKFSKKFKSIFKYIYQDYDIATILGHTGDPNVKANIAIIDMTWKFTSKKSIRWELQGLWTKEDKGDWAAALVEYTISPHWFFTIADQYNYGNKHSDERIHYYTGSFGYTLKTTRFALTYGRQREGVVCVGGVCRQVPASSGFYVTISSSF